MIIVFRIIIEHSKDCTKFKYTKKIVHDTPLEVWHRELVFNDCKEVNKYWRKLSKELNIPKNRITFLMNGDCLLQ